MGTTRDQDLGVEGFLHAVLSVPDMDEAVSWFRDLLGLRVTWDRVHDPAVIGALTGYPDPDARAAILECPDGSEIELVEFRRPRGNPTVVHDWCDAGINFVTFRVHKLESVIDRLRSAGVKFTGAVVTEVLGDGATVKVVYCFGPGRITVCLAELPPGRRILGLE